MEAFSKAGFDSFLEELNEYKGKFIVKYIWKFKFLLNQLKKEKSQKNRIQKRLK